MLFTEFSQSRDSSGLGLGPAELVITVVREVQPCRKNCCILRATVSCSLKASLLIQIRTGLL